MVRCSYAATTSSGRVSKCPGEATHDCGKCESHFKCPKCGIAGCFTPRSCRSCGRCFDHCACNQRENAVATNDTAELYGDGPRTGLAHCDQVGELLNPDLPEGLDIGRVNSPPESWRGSESCGSKSDEIISGDDASHYITEEYRAPERLPIFSLRREEIARRWSVLVDAGNGSERIMPWHICDLAWIAPVAQTPGGVDISLGLEVRNNELVLSCGGITRKVVRCSELYVMPWATIVRHYWPGFGLVARKIFQLFYDLIDAGEVRIIDGAAYTDPDPRPHIEFDVPIPAVGRAHLLGMVSGLVSLRGAWRFMAKSKRKECGPPLLDRRGFTPRWWPSKCSHGGLTDVGAFFDGSELISRGQSLESPDRAVAIRQTDGGVVMSAFIDDVFDTRVAGAWVDGEAIDTCQTTVATGGYVIGTDSRSCLLGFKDALALKAIAEFEVSSLKNKLTFEYTRFGACARIGRLLSLRKVHNYPVLGSASRMGVPRAIRTIALSPFQLPLSGKDNCVFELFRDCNNMDGRSFGKIGKEDLIASGLLLEGSAAMYTAIGLRGLVVEDNHIRNAVGEEEPSNICRVDGPFGLPGINATISDAQCCGLLVLKMKRYLRTCVEVQGQWFVEQEPHYYDLSNFPEGLAKTELR